MRTTPLPGPAVWAGRDIQQSGAWTVTLTGAQVAEIEAAVAGAESRGLAVEDVTEHDFPLPTLSPVVAEWTRELEDGRGFLLVRGLPAGRFTERQAGMAFWGIGRHMGIPVSQNAAGDLLGHVRDTGRSIKDPSVRGYQTRVRLPYHTDGSDVVGLLCLQTARSGGTSSIVSSGAVYNEVLRRRPDLLPLLYEPFYFDRREEQAEGEEPYYATPLAAYLDGKLSIRYIRGFIQSAQRHAAVPRLTDRQVELLDLVDSIANEDGFPLFMDFAPGDMQFVSNYAILHSRTAYEDHDDPARKRHLLRLWLTLRAGRRLPPDFGRGLSADQEGGRGGIAPRFAQHA